MKPFSIAACFAGLWLTPMFFLGQAVGQRAFQKTGHPTCHITLRASVELASGEFSLADLLDDDTCPQLREAAARVPLGKVPLAGSARVLAGEAVRAGLRELAEDGRAVWGAAATAVLERINVPERIMVRRSGARASCADIVRKMVRKMPESAGERPQISASGIPNQPAADRARPRAIDCGAADRIPQDTPLEFSPPVWDPTLGGWEVYARCVQPADCVPFLVRLRSRDSPMQPGSVGGANRSTIAKLAAGSAPFLDQERSGQTSSDRTTPGSGPPTARVRPGQTVTLLWDQEGIRLVIPAVALDAGVSGERVRARIVRGGALVPAIVVSAGMLRAAS
jgi:hypothetical protein